MLNLGKFTCCKLFFGSCAWRTSDAKHHYILTYTSRTLLIKDLLHEEMEQSKCTSYVKCRPFLMHLKLKKVIFYLPFRSDTLAIGSFSSCSSIWASKRKDVTTLHCSGKTEVKVCNQILQTDQRNFHCSFCPLNLAPGQQDAKSNNVLYLKDAVGSI